MQGTVTINLVSVVIFQVSVIFTLKHILNYPKFSVR